MASSVAAIQNGFDYQAYLFWTEAARLLVRGTNYHRVGYEIPGMKSFDDVAVFYRNPVNGPRVGERIHESYFQVKFKTDFSGHVTADCLLDPAFINATSESFLMKVKNAINKMADPTKHVSFSLYTPWSVAADDELGPLVRGSHCELKKELLFSGGPASKFGKLRQKWADHLGVDSDDELWSIISTVRVESGQASLKQLKDKASMSLQLAGLTPIDHTKRADIYPSLIQKLQSQGHSSFDANQLRQICLEEELLDETVIPKIHGKRLGIKSFHRFAESMETETEKMIDVVDKFDVRSIKDPKDWNASLKPKIKEFIVVESKDVPAIELHLDTHSSLAAVAGYFSDPKSNTENFVLQKTANKQSVWKNSAAGLDPNLPKMTVVDRCSLNPGGSDECFAIAISQMAFPEVVKFCQQDVTVASKVSHLGLPEGSGSAIIIDGTHASALAEQTRDILKAARLHMDPTATLHLFISAPNSFSYFLGRLLSTLGNIRLYEYKFNEPWPELYRPSIDFP